MDFFILKKILCAEYRPYTILVEYNAHIPSSAGAYVTPLTDPPSRCIGYCNGMSIKAVKYLGKAFNYTLLYGMKNGVNALLVRNDKLPFGFTRPHLSDIESSYKHSQHNWRNAQPKWDHIAKGSLRC